jgi:D-sedoheptulose 7-phosphate isomerase
MGQAPMSDYFATLADALSLGPPPELEQAAQLVHAAVLADATIFTFGNGACAALASHLAADLGKQSRGRVKIVSLVDNPVLLTAYANDESYECVFEQPLRGLLREGDVAFGISGSGRSENVLRALELARSAGGRTLAFTGSMEGTDRLIACCDVVVRAPLDVIEQIEDLHVVFAHVLQRAVTERLGE